MEAPVEGNARRVSIAGIKTQGKPGCFAPTRLLRDATHAIRKSNYLEIAESQNDQVWRGRGCRMSGRDDVAGCLPGEARGNRRGNSFFWSPLPLRICLSPAKNGVLRLSTGRNLEWPADPRSMDMRRPGDGEILSQLGPVTL